MQKDFSRADRFSQQLQREIAQIIQRELKDPRLVLPTVADVEVSKDLAYARVYMTFLSDEDEQVEQSLDVLNDAAGYVRSLLGKRVRSRVTPELRFIHDTSLNEGLRMSRLVAEARASDEQKNNGNKDD